MPFVTALREARSGSKLALGTIMESCRGYITAIASREIPRNLQSRLRPSSLVQETYVRACKSFAGFDGQSERQLLAWLRQIMLNCMINTLRRPEFRVPVLQLTEEPGRSADRPDVQAADREAMAALACALDSLPACYRMAIELRHFDRLSFEEIGLLLNRSAEATRKLWVRAQAKLGEILQSFQ